MQMFEAYLRFWKNYFNFSGRAIRTEYWFAHIVNFIVLFLLENLIKLCAFSESAALFMLYIYLLYRIALIIPSISLLFRRLHDIGKSGWYILIGVIPFIIPLLKLNGWYTLSNFIPVIFSLLKLNIWYNIWYGLVCTILVICCSLLKLKWLFTNSQPGTNKYGVSYKYPDESKD